MKNIEDDSKMIRLTACVSGRVQRVGYRAKVVSPANERDLVGIVQNRPDGSLLVIAEGEEKDNWRGLPQQLQSRTHSSMRIMSMPNTLRDQDNTQLFGRIEDGFENLNTIAKDGFEGLGLIHMASVKGLLILY